MWAVQRVLGLDLVPDASFLEVVQMERDMRPSSVADVEQAWPTSAPTNIALSKQLSTWVAKHGETHTKCSVMDVVQEPAKFLQCVACKAPVVTPIQQIEACGNPACTQPVAPGGGERFVVSDKDGHTFCTACGYVVTTLCFGEGEDARTFEETKAEGESNSRHGDPENPYLGNSLAPTRLVRTAGMGPAGEKTFRALVSSCTAMNRVHSVDAGARGVFNRATTVYCKDTDRLEFMELMSTLSSRKVVDPRVAAELKLIFAHIRNRDKLLRKRELFMGLAIMGIIKTYMAADALHKRAEAAPNRCLDCGIVLKGPLQLYHYRECSKRQVKEQAAVVPAVGGGGAAAPARPVKRVRTHSPGSMNVVDEAALRYLMML